MDTPNNPPPAVRRGGPVNWSAALWLATLSLSLVAFSPSASAQSAGISGERAYARITRSKQALTVNPSQVGNFPTIDVRPQAAIQIEVIYLEGTAGQAVTLTAQEGGTLGNGKPTQDITLDSQKKAVFTFATGSGRGLYQVLLRKGTDFKVLEFWVGEKLPVATE